MFKIFTKTALIIAALTFTAGQAQALKIKELTLKALNGDQEIHVKFDKSQNNWTTVTSKTLSLNLEWYLKARSLKAIDSNISSYPQKLVTGDCQAASCSPL